MSKEMLTPEAGDDTTMCNTNNDTTITITKATKGRPVTEQEQQRVTVGPGNVHFISIR